MVLIETTLLEVLDGRPLFPNPFDEPHFYRKYFKAWVREGVSEVRTMQDIREKTQKIVLGTEG